MTRFAITCCILLAAIAAPAATNLPSARSLRLDEKAAFDLTAGLVQYTPPPAFAGKFASVGGGSPAVLVNRWAAEFAELHPKVEFESRGGGSVNGLLELLAGRTDLVPMSRPLLAEDVARFKAKFGYEPAQILVAQDAIAVYVNKINPITGLTFEQLDAIYSREARRGHGRPEFWSELGVAGPLANQLIHRVSLSDVYGSQVYFQDQVMQGADFRFDVRFEAVPGSMIQAVGAEDNAIGFASVMIATARTRFVPLQAADGSYVLPDYENTLSGKYPLIRPMRIVFNRRPDGSMNPAAREFLRFAVSRRGQRIIALAGSYPLTVEQQQEALRTIGEAPAK